jgi:uncharacterized protein
MGADFIGRGLAFPTQTSPTGAIALVGDTTDIEQAILLILGTAVGERPMRPEFGCGIHDYVFATADATTGGRVAFAVRSALERWEPRINVLDVSVKISGDDRSVLLVDITYAVRGSNDPRNLVYPFYTIPDKD